MSFSGPIKDRLELRELLDAYADAVCQNNPDDWGLCWAKDGVWSMPCLLYTSPSPRDQRGSRMPSSA